MDFSKLLAKAGKNMHESKKKIDKLAFEEKLKIDEFRKHREKLLQGNKKPKKILKEPSPPPKKHRIPKISGKNGPSKDAVSHFLAKQWAEKRNSERERIRKREQLLEARIRANGGKISKKIIEQFGLTPGEIRKRTSLFPTQEASQKRKEQIEKSKNPVGERVHEKFMSQVRNSASKCAVKSQEKVIDKKFVPEKSRQPKSSAKPKLNQTAPPLNFRELMMTAATIQQKVEAGEMSKTPSPSPEPEPVSKPVFAEKTAPQRHLSAKGTKRSVSIGGSRDSAIKNVLPAVKKPKIDSSKSKICQKTSVPQKNVEEIRGSVKNRQKFGEKPALKRPPTQQRTNKSGMNGSSSSRKEAYRFMDRDQLRSVRDRFQPPDNRKTISDQDESEEYDSEMEDFIDDTEEYHDDEFQAKMELSKTLKEKFRYDKNKFKHEKWDRWSDAQMHASFGQIAAEEARSSRIAKLEDEIELLREQKMLKEQLGLLKKK